MGSSNLFKTHADVTLKPLQFADITKVAILGYIKLFEMV